MASHRADGSSLRRTPTTGRRRAQNPDRPTTRDVTEAQSPFQPLTFGPVSPAPAVPATPTAQNGTLPPWLVATDVQSTVVRPERPRPSSRRAAPSRDVDPRRADPSRRSESARREAARREATRRPPSPRVAESERSHGRRRAAPPPRAPWTNHLPQAGVVGVLGLATIVAPLAGEVLPGRTAEAQATTQGATVAAAAILPVHDTAVELGRPDDPDRVAPTAEELAVERAEIERVSRENERIAQEQAAVAAVAAQAQAAADAAVAEAARFEAAVPGCSGKPAVTDASNGQLDTGDLCELWGTGQYLRSDAAMALAQLSFAYQAEFGEDLQITDGYRSYSSQVSVRSRKPGLAARPGTSQHGWGLAVDLGGLNAGSARYDWLSDNAPSYGWDNPDWARSGGSGPFEPWHWEYLTGQAG